MYVCMFTEDRASKRPLVTGIGPAYILFSNISLSMYILFSKIFSSDVLCSIDSHLTQYYKIFSSDMLYYSISSSFLVYMLRFSYTFKQQGHMDWRLQKKSSHCTVNLLLS